MCFSWFLVPHPERTPSLAARRRPSTISPPQTSTRHCQRLLAKVPRQAASANTSTPRTASATSGPPWSREPQAPALSGSCTSGSSATSSGTAAPLLHSTPRPQNTRSARAHRPPRLPRPPGLKGRRVACRCHPQEPTSLRRGRLQAAAELCRPIADLTRQLNG